MSKGAILITGAAKRIGRQLAVDLAAAGYDIAVHFNKSATDAEDVAASIRAMGRRAVLVQADLANADAAESLISSCFLQMGGLSALINNASIYEFDQIGEIGAESWQRHMDINLRAPVLLAQAFAAQLPQGAKGNIVNLIDGRVWKLNPLYFSYTVSKSALWTATRTLAQALAPNIRVNAIGPGPVLPPKGMSTEEHTRDEANTLLRHGVSPAEISAAVSFILSQSGLTGQMIALDSGQHLLWNTREMGEVI